MGEYEKPRSFRVGDEVFDRAKLRAEHEGITMSIAVKTFLEAYGKGMMNLPKRVLRYDRSA